MIHDFKATRIGPHILLGEDVSCLELQTSLSEAMNVLISSVMRNHSRL